MSELMNFSGTGKREVVLQASGISKRFHEGRIDVTVLQGHDDEDTNVRLTMTPLQRRS